MKLEELKKNYGEKIKKWIKYEFRSYIDPDGIFYKNMGDYIYECTYNDKKFYKDYATVLGKRMTEKFKVKFIDGIPGIVIYSKKTYRYYYLKSDQFGFSCPSDKLNHVYDIYLLKAAEKAKKNVDYLEEAKKNVKEWISKTRKVGGSFFWPMEYNNGEYELNPNYNILRGGSSNKKGGSYIEDRVDYTLLEIKEIYDSGILKLQDNVLYKNCCSSNLMENWLKEFDSFEEYVNFFAFQPFVDKESMMPLNIMTQPLEPLEPFDDKNNKRDRLLYSKQNKNDKDNNREESEEIEAVEYERMLNNIVKMIEERRKELGIIE